MPGCYVLTVDDFVARVVQRLREEPGFSRNRHFLAFSSPEGRRALRIHRHLRSIERDLSRGSQAVVDREPQRVRLTLRSRAGVRMAWLSPDEFQLLCTSPLVRVALAADGVGELPALPGAGARPPGPRRVPPGA